MEKNSIYKKCPRCGEKNYIINKKCDNCGLIFSRLEYASNRKAKECMIKGEREKVIFTKDFPKDLSRLKMIILCACGGILGLHNIYAGRFIKGYVSLIYVVVTAMLLLIMGGAWISDIYMRGPFVIGGLIFFFWFYDLMMLIINKYRIPIAIDMPDLEVKEKAFYKKELNTYVVKDSKIVKKELDNQNKSDIQAETNNNSSNKPNSENNNEENNVQEDEIVERKNISENNVEIQPKDNKGDIKND